VNLHRKYYLVSLAGYSNQKDLGLSGSVHEEAHLCLS